jgi:hypothetical protein
LDLIHAINEGWHLWSKNKALSAPYLLSIAATYIIVAAAIIACYLVIASLDSASTPATLAGIAFILIIFAVGALASIVVSAYFTVAGIQMASKAKDGQTVSVSDSFNPKREYVSTVIVIYLVTGLVILLVGGFLVALQIILKVGLTPVLSMLAGCILMFAPYYAVLSGKDWKESIKSGYAAFKGNKFAVAVFWGFTNYFSSISFGLVLPLSLIVAALIFLVTNPSVVYVTDWSAFIPPLAGWLVSLFVFATLLSAAVLQPLTTIWQLSLFKQLQGGPK